MDNVELRLGWDGAAIENGESLGGSDVSVGARWHLLDQDGLIPSLGATFTLSLPTGGKRNTSDEVEPDFLLAWSYDLSDLLSVGGHVTAGAPADDNGHHFFQTTAAVSVGFSLSDKVGSYVEYFIIHPAERHSDSEHNVGAGLTYLLTDNIQLDLQGTYGLNERATEFSIGGGIALRW
ncbi:transporter [bacterium AH-315-M10]|nr:transporter [bacterium AH-315-M10]